MKYVLITMCPPNLSVYEISVSIFPINCVTQLFTVFPPIYVHILLLMKWRLIFFRIKNENKGIILPHLWIFSFFTYNLYIICDLFESVIYNTCDYDISIMFWSTYVSPIIPDVQKKRDLSTQILFFLSIRVQFQLTKTATHPSVFETGGNHFLLQKNTFLFTLN